jgi:hypothetical protein
MTIRRFVLISALCMVESLPIAARAGETAGASLPLQATLRKEDAPFADPRYTAFITVLSRANKKFAFLVPQGFSLRGDPASGTMTLANWQGNSSITFAILDSDSSDTSALSADDYRELVLREYPTAVIVKEFNRYAARGSGPAFDLQWKASGSIVECKRVMFISTPAGVLEFTATTSQKNFDELNKSLDSMLQTFRLSTDGVLKVPPLPSSS